MRADISESNDQRLCWKPNSWVEKQNSLSRSSSEMEGPTDAFGDAAAMNSEDGASQHDETSPGDTPTPPEEPSQESRARTLSQSSSEHLSRVISHRT